MFSLYFLSWLLDLSLIFFLSSLFSDLLLLFLFLILLVSLLIPSLLFFSISLTQKIKYYILSKKLIKFQLKMFNIKKFTQMKENNEKYRITGDHPFHEKPIKEDIEFLNKSKKEAIIYPTIFTILFAPSFYIFVHRAQMPLFFQNPLKDPIPSYSTQVRKFKNHFAGMMILGFSSLAFFGSQLRHHISRYWLYLEYKNLVDRYVVLRDERLLEETIRENRRGLINRN